MSDQAPKGYTINITPIQPQDGVSQSWSVRADAFTVELLRSMGTIDFHEGLDGHYPRGFCAWVDVAPSEGVIPDGYGYVGFYDTLVDAVKAIDDVDHWIDDGARP